REQLDRLAETLLHSEFVVSGSRLSTALNQLKTENPDLSLNVLDPAELSTKVYRVKKPTDPELPEERLKTFNRINIIMWKVVFENELRRLSYRPLIGLTRERAP
ncbi:MAG: hypothetical protein AAF492_16760, partial [Verrucomicrobiota bacterium]